MNREDDMEFVHGAQPPRRDVRRWAKGSRSASTYSVRPDQGGYVVFEISQGVERDLAWFATYAQADKRRAQLCGG